MDNLNTHTPASFYEVFPPEPSSTAWKFTWINISRSRAKHVILDERQCVQEAKGSLLSPLASVDPAAFLLPGADLLQCVAFYRSHGQRREHGGTLSICSSGKLKRRSAQWSERTSSTPQAAQPLATRETASGGGVDLK